MPRPTFTCHACGVAFGATVTNEWGLYEFHRCPRCGSARTTLARAVDAANRSDG